MWLEKISLVGVRNLVDREFNFDPNVNYFFGDNGAGKTSILEAIHFLAVGRSFRTSRDNEIIKFDAPYLKITGEAYKNNEKYQAEIRLFDGVKTAYLQQHKQDKLSSYLGWLPVVTILLSDIDLVSAAPDRRRNFIDLAIAKINKTYLRNLIEYRAVLLQRNKLLQEKTETAYYEVWEASLAKFGANIYQERIKIIPTLLSRAQKFYSMFMPDHKITFEYKANFDNLDIGLEKQEQNLFSRLVETRAKDQEIGYTSVGPHRDDIVIKENSLAVRRFGSEGEQRLAALALKLAEGELLENNNRKPIFLLDEVAAELDLNNTKRLFELIQGQFFYATAKELKNLTNGPGRVFYVQNGKIEKTETIG